MNKSKTISKENVFEIICKAARSNTLGLFIGSGFTKAVLTGNNKAYDWKELLQESCYRMGIHRDVFNEGMTYPQIASTICHEYVQVQSVSLHDADRKLKLTISDLVNVSPSKSILSEYENYFKELIPNWIVTTNYDLIIEKILHEKAFLINPKDSFIKTKDFIPVYHIHGSVTDPESIVITNEDYTQTLRFSDYRHARLPFLIKESTVLMVGYSLNDLNVLSAVDYSQNVYTNVSATFETPIIQLIYKKYPNEDPYIDNNIIIQEIKNLSDYFSELIDFIKRYKSIVGKKSNEVKKLLEFFTNADGKDISSFIADKNKRQDIFNAIKSIDFEFWYIYPSYMAFLNKSFGILWDKAQVQNAFSYYRDILDLLLDIVENIDYEKVPFSLLEYLIKQFKDISYFVGNVPGQSWAAKNLWVQRCHDIPEEFINELNKYLTDDFDVIRIDELLKVRNNVQTV